MTGTRMGAWLLLCAAIMSMPAAPARAEGPRWVLLTISKPYVALNDDDDNNDGDYDHEDSGEDHDLVELSLAKSSGGGGTIQLGATAGDGQIRIWKDSARTEQFSLPKSWPAGQMPSTVYVEGVSASEDFEDVQLYLIWVGWPPANDTEKCTVVKVNQTVAGGDDEKEYFNGTIIALNDDDDDADELVDNDPAETDVQGGDDDLVAITLHKVEPYQLTGPVTLTGGGSVKVWTAANKGTEVTLPQEYQTPAELPQALYVEGVAAGDAVLTLSYTVGGTTIEDKVRFLVTVSEFDLAVHDGLNAPEAVAENKEESRGAISVANLNNTDSDTVGDPPQPRVDKDETGEDEANQIPNEKDMIKLVITANEAMDGGVKLEFTEGGEKVKVWMEQTKEGGEVEKEDLSWQIGDIPAGVELWIEGLEKSDSVRDIEVVLRKDGDGGDACPFKDGDVLDKARLTFVWATRTDREFSRKTAAALMATDWGNMTIPPKDWFTGDPPKCDGTGLLEYCDLGMINVMVMKFRIDPPLVWKEPGIAVDVSRQGAGKGWIELWGTWTLVRELEDPGDDETASDDGGDDDESPTPNDNGEVFVADHPGGPQYGTAVTQFVFRANFMEFVRIRFNGTRPTGNTDGSRCSDKYPWHCCHRWTQTGNGWVRNQGENINEIVDGLPPITIGDNP